jgi:hypothetical protein
LPEQLGHERIGDPYVKARADSVFVGTNVPVQALLDWLDQGETLDEFLRYSPSVTRDQALAVSAEFAARTRRRPVPGKPAPPA